MVIETQRTTDSGQRTKKIALAVSASIVILAATRGATQTTSSAPAPRTKTDPKINEPFKKPDVKAYIKKFESDDREIYVKRHEIVAALGLVPGMSVADVGAGTGLFTRLLAEKVGPTGKVYASTSPLSSSLTSRPTPKTQAEPGRDFAGKPRDHEPRQELSRPGLPLRRVSSPGETGESACFDPRGPEARRQARRDRI